MQKSKKFKVIANKIAQQLKVLANKSDNFSSIPRTHKRELTPISFLLTSTHASCSAYSHDYMQKFKKVQGQPVLHETTYIFY